MPRRALSPRIVLSALALAGVTLLGGAAAAIGASTPGPGIVGSDQQTWDPVLAGGAVRVQVGDGTVRLATARDGEPPERAGSLRGAVRQGFLDLGAHTFDDAVDRLEVPVTADVPPGTSVVADVRGRDDAGRWSEWTTAAPGVRARLPAATRTVALRLTLTAPADTAGPVVRAVSVRADRGDDGPRAVEPRVAYRVFATREGLVGGTTANGHMIREDDHFVALPSRRVLSGEGGGEYSVRICTDAGRCAVVPVWDVGPWNVTDDYWNAAPPREDWGDLPRGRPQAAAAHDDGYHGGEDGFGRPVKNPAGIDVADGTFADLGLRDNGVVTVEYLWTGPDPAAGDARLARADSPDGPVIVRSGPADGALDVGIVGDDAQVDVPCRVAGQETTGTRGTSSDWLRLSPGRFVPAAWMIVDGSPAPTC